MSQHPISLTKRQTASSTTNLTSLYDPSDNPSHFHENTSTPAPPQVNANLGSSAAQKLAPAFSRQSILSYILPVVVSLIFTCGFIIGLAIIIPYGFTTWPWRLIHTFLGITQLYFCLYSYWKGVFTNPGLVHATWDRVREYREPVMESPVSQLDMMNGNVPGWQGTNALSGTSNALHEHSFTTTNTLTNSTIGRTSSHHFTITTSTQMTHSERKKLLLLEPNHDRTPRYCEKCKCYKPPRSHHSTFYGRCVLRYDHFCVWLNNTIGHQNHRYFFLFLFYTVSIWLHFTGASAYTLFVLARTGEIENPVAFIALLCYAIFMSPMGFLVTLFFLWHTWLLITNQTSVEFHINGDVKRRISKVKSRLHHIEKHVDFFHIYNTSIYENISTVMGPHWTRWFIPPLKVDIGDGIRYRTVPDEKREALHQYLYEIEALPKDEDDLYDDYEMGGGGSDRDDDDEYGDSSFL